MALIIAPASTALAGEADGTEPGADPGGDAVQPVAPEPALPSPAQEDQVTPEPEPMPAPAPEPGAEDPEGDAAAEPPADAAGTQTPSLDAAVPEPEASGLAAATPPPDSYFGTGKVTVDVQPDDGDEFADLTSTIVVTHDDDEAEPWDDTITTNSQGGYNSPFGYNQTAGHELTFTLSVAPEGYMLTDDVAQVVQRCVVPSTTPPAQFPNVDCYSSVTFPVVRDYRTVGAVTRTAAGSGVAGVTVELHSPEAVPEPDPDPTDPPTGSPSPTAALGSELAAVVIPGRTLIATGVTDAAGHVVFDSAVPPADGYLLVPTAVPAGYYLPDPVSADIGSVPTVAEAALSLDVPITVVAVPVITPPVITPPRYEAAGAALPATGNESGALAGIAAGLVVSGIGVLWTGRRLAVRG